MKAIVIGILGLMLLGSLYAADLSLAPGPKDKCAVCGMFVAEFKTWVAAVVYADGHTAWFDGPKDLFTYLHDQKQYARGRKAEDIRDIVVTDYYTAKPARAREAFFVTGSDVTGPMGAEVVPFVSKAEAQTFLADHKGTKLLSFDEVTPAILSSLK